MSVSHSALGLPLISLKKMLDLSSCSGFSRSVTKSVAQLGWWGVFFFIESGLKYDNASCLKANSPVPSFIFDILICAASTAVARSRASPVARSEQYDSAPNGQVGKTSRDCLADLL